MSPGVVGRDVPSLTTPNCNDNSCLVRIRVPPVAAMTEKATHASIQDGMARVQKVACRSGDDGCHPFPDLVEDIRAIDPSTGRYRIG